MVNTGEVEWQKGPEIEGVDLEPHNVTVTADGRIVVADGINQRALVFHQDTTDYYKYKVG